MNILSRIFRRNPKPPASSPLPSSPQPKVVVSKPRFSTAIPPSSRSLPPFTVSMGLENSTTSLRPRYSAKPPLYLGQSTDWVVSETRLNEIQMEWEAALARGYFVPLSDPDLLVYSPYPVLGLRIWTLSSDEVDGTPFLRGGFGGRWTSPNVTAVCVACNRPLEKMPHLNGRCGIYARSRDSRHRILRPPTEWAEREPLQVYGLVAMTGVIEHTAGYRGRHARIVALCVQDPHRHLLMRAWPEVEYPRSHGALMSVWDYYQNNPEKIPAPEPETSSVVRA